jgi:hypothetical protein
MHHHYRHCRLSGPIQKDWHMVKSATGYTAKVVIARYARQRLTSSQDTLSPPVAGIVKVSAKGLVLQPFDFSCTCTEACAVCGEHGRLHTGTTEVYP